MIFNILNIIFNISLVLKFCISTSALLVPEESADKFREMCQVTALLFLAPGVFSSLPLLKMEVRNQLGWELLNSLQYIVGFYNIYLFWRMLSLCIDPQKVAKSLGKQVKEDFDFSVLDCSNYRTKFIVLLLYGPVVIVVRLLWQLLSPDSLGESLVTVLWIEVSLRWVTTTAVMQYSRKMINIIKPFTALWRPKEKSLLVMLLYPVTLLVHDTYLLRSVLANKQRYNEVGSDAFSIAQVFYRTDLGETSQDVLQGQILLLSTCYWILWWMDDFRTVFEHDPPEEITSTKASEAGSAQWEDVKHNEAGDLVQLTSWTGMHDYQKLLLDETQRESPEEFAYENLLDLS